MSYIDISQDGIDSEMLEHGVRELGSCPNDEYLLIAKIKTDNNPADNAWALLKSGSGWTLAKGNMTNWQAGVTTRMRMCLPLGSYIFRMKDASANGMCQDDVCGSVVLTLDGVEIERNENDNSTWSTKDFLVDIGMLTGKAAVTTTTTTSTTMMASTSTIMASIEEPTADNSTQPSVNNSTSTVPQSTLDAVDTPLSSLDEFQDLIILSAAQIASDGEQGIGSLIIDKVCADAVAQRVVEAYHRQNKTVEQTIEGLKLLSNITSS
jgi:hypothetical protein